MGDRANVYVHGGKNPGVYLYTHWGRRSIGETVAAALDRGRGRWDDEQYLARIIFCEMVRDDIEGVTGYGISAEVWDGAESIVDVDTRTGLVTVKGVETPFEDFVEGGGNES